MVAINSIWTGAWRIRMAWVRTLQWYPQLVESSFNVNPAMVPAILHLPIPILICATASWQPGAEPGLEPGEYIHCRSSIQVFGQSIQFDLSIGLIRSGSNATLPYIPKNQADANLKDNGLIPPRKQMATGCIHHRDKYFEHPPWPLCWTQWFNAPMNHELDMKLMHEFKLSKTTAGRPCRWAWIFLTCWTWIDNSLVMLRL